MYGSFVRVYDMVPHIAGTGAETLPKDERLSEITGIAGAYGEDSLGMDKTLSILYLAMIAEENKEHSILGKRIKRLGVHILLKDGKSVEESATFMKGMGWRKLDAMCSERGF